MFERKVNKKPLRDILVMYSVTQWGFVRRTRGSVGPRGKSIRLVLRGKRSFDSLSQRVSGRFSCQTRKYVHVSFRLPLINPSFSVDPSGKFTCRFSFNPRVC